LQQAPMENNEQISTTIISFPNSNGQLERFKIFEAPVMDAALAANYPNIKSYTGKGIDDATASIRFSTTIFGLHVMSLSGKAGSYFIDTYTKNLQNYIVYDRKNVSRTSTFSCSVENSLDDVMNRGLNENTILASDGQFRVYRLAMACTIEYAAFHVNAAGLGAGTLAQKKAAVLAAMVVSMTRVNGLYERDMSLRMNLVANNDLVIFIDSDNFNNTNAGTLINQSQTVIDGAIGLTNYDIGHTVSTGGGGLAQLNSPCTNSKARGITGSAAPVGDPFDIDYVAHEMGHQFGATHTFNNSCGGNISTSTSVEPGSGTTIMAYAGICAPDIQSNSDAHFHAVSLAQMATFVAGTGNCAPNNPNNNAAPVITVANATIPRGTAFILKGTATDANGDALTYCWEQTNTQVSTQPPLQTSATGPNFRSNPPSTSPNRFMPVFSEVLNGNLAPTWEVVPNVARSMNFALTVRDNRMPNGGQTGRANMVVTVNSNGPFRISSPDITNTSWPLGSSQLLTWDVANTNAAPINTANVKISYSTDGGVTFTTLIVSTPNDGSETITVPNTLSTTARIMIEAVGNIYYCVSKNIAFGYSIVNACETYTDAIPLPFIDQAPGNFTTRTLNIPITGTISDVNVFHSLTHTYLSDVQTDISSPQSPTTFVKLFNRSCGNTSGTLNLKFSDGGATINCLGGATLQTVSPNVALSAFNGQNPQGNWTFRVYDNFAGDSGTINSWAIEICTQTVTLLTEDFGLDQFGLFPNPNNGNFNIKFNSSSGNEISVAVHDIRGREIFNQGYQNTGMFEQNIQLSSVQSGVYVITVKDGERKEVKKIVIE